MMMRLDEIDENFQAKVVLHTTNKTEQVPMEVDHVSGSEPDEED